MNTNLINFRNTANRQQMDARGVLSLGVAPESLLPAVEKLFKQLPVEWNKTGFYSSMMIAETDYRNKVCDQLEALVGDCLNEYITDYEILFSNFLVKLPGTDNYIGMHQDWNFVDEEQSESINFWIPLLDVNDENGNLYAVEGSHKTFTQLRGTPYFNYFENHEWAFEKIAKPLYPKRGEFILYHGRLLHFSKPNQSGKQRVAIGGVLIPKGVVPLHYRCSVTNDEVKWQKYTVDKSFFRWFTPESEIEGYTSEPVKMPVNYFSRAEREKIILKFLNAHSHENYVEK